MVPSCRRVSLCSPLLTRRRQEASGRYAIAFPFSLHSSLIRRDRVAPLRGSCLRRVVSEKRTEGEATIRTAGTEGSGDERNPRRVATPYAVPTPFSPFTAPTHPYPSFSRFISPSLRSVSCPSLLSGFAVGSHVPAHSHAAAVRHFVSHSLTRAGPFSFHSRTGQRPPGLFPRCLRPSGFARPCGAVVRGEETV